MVESVASGPVAIAAADIPWIDRRALVVHLRSRIAINWMGHHGIAHWIRVRANGADLARLNGADAHVVELFAFFHDSCRVNEYRDTGHGVRGGALAVALRGQYFGASDAQMELLVLACSTHTDGHMSGDVTVRTCWDSDRLDLGRVGIEPDPLRMSTVQARLPHVLEKARLRSQCWLRQQ